MKDLKSSKGNISQGFGLGQRKDPGSSRKPDIFGRKKRVQTSLKKVQTKIIDSFVELKPWGLCCPLELRYRPFQRD
jgi:hypothetical protein